MNRLQRNEVNKLINPMIESFPFKRPDILELWIKAVRKENWAPSRSSKLCGDHFLPTDYMVKPGCFTKRSKPNAVPTVFSYPKHLLPKIAKPRRKIKKLELSVDVHTEDVISNTICPENIDLPSTSTSSQVQTLIDCETQTVPYKDILLQRKVKTLKQKVKRRDVNISNMKEVIHSISKSGRSNEKLDEILKKHFEGLPLELVLLQKGKDEGVGE
ncbi:hypothetical protein JTB14_007210 [Gonioctena quinquepunctata]|nr:hypothetical protein JTB14_007210 [Gonioctena quinquepunctata]